MKLTRDGLREILTATILCGLSVGLFVWAGIAINLLFLIVAVLSVAIWLWVLWFFRDPDRDAEIPSGGGLFISPADGVVADITPLGPQSKLGRDGVQIGVFMNVFDVHVNRMPCSGTVQNVTHLPGAFMDVRDPVAAEKNESVTIELTHRHKGQDYPVIVRQIAGLVARRIITHCTASQSVARGERFGMIKFGSRLELLLPRELADGICVEIGQKVQAGLTILASAAD